MNKEELLRELARLQEEERCRFFVPNGKQEEFIRMLGTGEKFINILSGGNGSGKTYVMVNILANLIWGPQNEYFNLPIFKKWPYPKRIRIGTEPKNLEQSGAIDEAITKWWPKGRYQANKLGKNYISQYTSDTGWVIDKMSYEQETKDWESATLGFVAFDEPPPREKYMASVARMRQGGFIMIDMTPLTGAGWVIDELLDSKSSGIVYSDMEDNCKDHGNRGTLEHVNIERMISQMDPDEIEARVHGRSMHLSNVILGRSFDRKFHIVPNDLTPPPMHQWGCVVDPARGKPWAIGWFWIDLRGQLVFDDEYPGTDWLKTKETNFTLPDYSLLLRQMEANRPTTWRILDRHFGNARNDYGTTLKMDLNDKFGLEFIDSYNCENEVETGIQKVKDYLGFQRAFPIDSTNFPRLRVKERCKNIIKALERWERNADPPHDPNSRSPYKDHFDLVRYACMANLSIDVPLPFPERKPRYVLGRN